MEIKLLGKEKNAKKDIKTKVFLIFSSS